MKSALRHALSAVAVLMLFVACASETVKKETQDLVADGKYEEGLAKLENAVKENPSDAALRAELVRQRNLVLDRLTGAAATLELNQQWQEATRTYQRALSIDPRNDKAINGLARVERDSARSRLLDEAEKALEAGEIDKAGAIVAGVLQDVPGSARALSMQRKLRTMQPASTRNPPSLSRVYPHPVDLEFRDANLKMVFEVLSKSTGINFILDRDVRPDLRTTIFLRNAALDDAINLLLLTNKLEKKVLSENSVLVYANTPEKSKEYRDLIIRSFYLLNADGQQAVASLRTLLKIKDITYDEKLNLVIIRDTPDVVALAEKLIYLHDLSEPEVMLELEVLEIQTSRLQELGIVFPQQIAFAPIPSSGSTLTVQDLRDIDSSRIAVSMPDTLINLKKETGAVNLLANPRVRVKNKGKAKVLIGDKVPVITSTATATGFVSENVQYLDVGLKLDIEPIVFLKDDVAINVALEVSNIAREIRSAAGSITYQIGTRTASTVLRLKDGETQVLAGLISDQDRRNASKVPGLGDIPMLGRLFSSHKDDRQKTEIVLSVTPRLIRNLASPDPSMLRLWSGTEEVVRQDAPIRLAEIREGASKQEETHLPVQESERDATFQSPSKITYELRGPAEVRPDEKFEVELWIDADGGIRNLPLQLGFDPQAFEFLDVIDGGFFSKDSASTSMAKSVDLAQGKIFVSIGRSTVNGAVGKGRVLRISFKALSNVNTASVRLLLASPVVVGDQRPAMEMPEKKTVSIRN